MGSCKGVAMEVGTRIGTRGDTELKLKHVSLQPDASVYNQSEIGTWHSGSQLLSESTTIVLTASVNQGLGG